MKTENVLQDNNNNNNDLDIFVFIYDLLFRPSKAKDTVLEMRKNSSDKLFFLSVLVLSMSFVSIWSVWGLTTATTNLLCWFVIVFVLDLLSWLFQPDKTNFDFANLFYFGAFTQIPLIFSGIACLWETFMLENQLFTFVINLWVFCLWIWAIKYSFRISFFKAVFLVSLPIIFLLFIVILFVILVMFVGLSLL